MGERPLRSAVTGEPPSGPSKTTSAPAPATARPIRRGAGRLRVSILPRSMGSSFSRSTARPWESRGGVVAMTTRVRPLSPSTAYYVADRVECGSSTHVPNRSEMSGCGSSCRRRAYTYRVAQLVQHLARRHAIHVDEDSSIEVGRRAGRDCLAGRDPWRQEHPDGNGDYPVLAVHFALSPADDEGGARWQPVLVRRCAEDPGRATLRGTRITSDWATDGAASTR